MKKKATVICWISTALAALALCLTCGLPLPAGIPPMLFQWLILPLLALLAAAVQAGRLLAGLRAALAGKPDGRLFCLLAAIGALALAVLGKGGSSAAAAALLLCADAWLEQLQARVDGELPARVCRQPVRGSGFGAFCSRLSARRSSGGSSAQRQLSVVCLAFWPSARCARFL